MPNGNTFIREGTKGRFFEITKDGKVVWEYLNPYAGDVSISNGSPFPSSRMSFGVFRATFIPANHPGLKGRKLEPVYPQPAVFVTPPAG